MSTKKAYKELYLATHRYMVTALMLDVRVWRIAELRTRAPKSPKVFFFFISIFSQMGKSQIHGCFLFFLSLSPSSSPFTPFFFFAVSWYVLL